MMKETPWKVFRDGGWKYRMQVRYGMDYNFARQNNQAPYFSITMAQYRQARNNRWVEDSFGAAHEAIARRFPALAPYIKWHLVSTDGPLHYMANAKYWWEIATGKKAPDKYQRTDPWEAFKGTVIFGGLPNDAETAPERSAPWEVWSQWLHNRAPILQETFRHAMKTLGVWEGS